jgi:hypothetical protein
VGLFHQKGIVVGGGVGVGERCERVGERGHSGPPIGRWPLVKTNCNGPMWRKCGERIHKSVNGSK